MRILAFTDPHTDGSCLEAVKHKSKQADLLICCGDFTVFRNGMSEVLDFFDQIGKKMLIVHGNHEDEHRVAEECKKRKNLVFIHKKILMIDNLIFIGWGGGGFAQTDHPFESWYKSKEKEFKGKRMVLVVHQPPANTKIDFLEWAGHVGSKSFRQFMDKHKPALVLCGHLHETFHMIDNVKDVAVLNPGPDGTLIEI
ncbi:MAG TPA: metallophosphoesterase family protein [Candidatus Nanoarchaeia archaeon]|nr:metallophosphoesterase family protein [Candidatus Nanoarchaeia archaeon]